MLSTFLGKITRNLALNRYKHNHAQKRGSGETALVLEELAECVTGDDTVENMVERQELTKAIDGFLAGLPVGKRNLFVCRYWYTDSIRDIAMRFGMKESAVAMSLHRIRRELLVYLTERGFCV